MLTQVIAVLLRLGGLFTRLLSAAGWRALAEGGDYAGGKELLGLEGLPVVEAAEIGDDGELADSSLFLQGLHLADYFCRGTDEADFLVHNFIVGEFGE